MAEVSNTPPSKKIVRSQTDPTKFVYVKGKKDQKKKIKLKKFGVRQIVKNKDSVEKFLQEIIANPPANHNQLETRKREFAKANKQKDVILNRDLISVAGTSGVELPPAVKRLLRKRRVRTISGVSPIGILTKPYACPGKCVYCPTEDRMPKSYMSNQPAAARALRNKFHPYRQVNNRVIAMQDSGHPVSKLEVIVMGGTWSFLPHKYQSWYVKKCFDAANDFTLPEAEGTTEKTKKKNNLHGTRNLAEAQKINETAENRIIGLTLETRPDFINERELIRMRRMGCTRIEIGVQTLHDDIQKLTKRGHKRRHVIRAMKLMKDFGFKVCFHIMPGLPGSNPERDLEMMIEVFSNPDFRPDFIKIYPCVVLETAELKQWWEDGRYEPMQDQELVKLLTQWMPHVPAWVRVMRLMRDIPVTNILDGARFSNLRQIMQDQPEKMKQIAGADWYEANFKDGVFVGSADTTNTLTQEFAIDDQKEGSERILEHYVYKKAEGTSTQWSNLEAPESSQGEAGGGAQHPPLGQKSSAVGGNFCTEAEGIKQGDEKTNKFQNTTEIKEQRPPIANWICQDIRTREVGFADLEKLANQTESEADIVLVRRDYEASDGHEVFLSFESRDRQTLYALLRLRKPSGQRFGKFGSVLHDAALIREVHSYGTELDLGVSGTPNNKSQTQLENGSAIFSRPGQSLMGQEPDANGSGLGNTKKAQGAPHGAGGQHRGFGRRMIAEAERIAKQDWGLNRVTIIAGVGTREYYRKWGYKLQSTYMTKKLS